MKTSFWTRLLDIISPRTCAICGERLSANERLICSSCHLHLPVTRYELSPSDNPMVRLFWGQFPVERAAAWFFYEPKTDTSQLIYDLKYRNHPEIGEALGAIIAQRFAEACFFDSIDALVPMPITRRRKWQRGYNQSMEIARGVASVCSLPILRKAVRRIRFSESQTTKHARERLRNVEDAFLLSDADAISGKHLLLIDDIVTTGATVIACARELAKAPGVKISILSAGITRS